MKDNTFGIFVPVYWENRVKRFVDSFIKHSPGSKFKLHFVHNCYEKAEFGNRIDERGSRPAQEIEAINEFLYSLSSIPELNDPVIILRDNVGEDFGAQRHSYNIFKGEYEYIFFISDLCMILQEGWLKKFEDCYLENIDVAATSSAICRGIRFPWHLRGTSWGARDSFLQKMYWPPPTSREDCEIQEMELVWPQVKSMGYNAAQVGTGRDLLNYYYDNGEVYTLFTDTPDHGVKV